MLVYYLQLFTMFRTFFNEVIIMKKSGRPENTRMRPDGIHRILTISLAALFCCSVLISALPASGANKNAIVGKSGKHNLNLHTRVQGDFRREVVTGQITEVRSDGIVMDGEFFRSARLQNDYETELLYTDIYVGLTASVVYNGGYIEKIIVHNLKRPMVIRDQKFIERERAKALRGR